METGIERAPLPFTTFEKSLVVIHGLVAAGMGIYGSLDVDPDWAAVQRIVILMMVGIWAGGIAASVLIARAVRRRWLRVVILLAGPFAGLAIVIGRMALGWV